MKGARPRPRSAPGPPIPGGPKEEGLSEEGRGRDGPGAEGQLGRRESLGFGVLTWFLRIGEMLQAKTDSLRGLLVI